LQVVAQVEQKVLEVAVQVDTVIAQSERQLAVEVLLKQL
tara:strand:- start:561 stop:677 length:117 start_codon:yes stop_codon:yes gene_type:complete